MTCEKNLFARARPGAKRDARKCVRSRPLLRPDALEVTAGPGELLARIFPDALEVAAGPGEHIFAHDFLRPDALEAAAGPGEHIFARCTTHNSKQISATGAGCSVPLESTLNGYD